MGYKHTEEAKRKISASQKGKSKPKTEEHKRKLSEATKGIPRGAHSEEHKQKIGLGNKKRNKAKKEAQRILEEADEILNTNYNIKEMDDEDE